MSRMEKVYNKVVSVNTESKEIYILDYVFDDGDGFKGATGAVLTPYTQSMIDDRRDVDEVMATLEDIVSVEQLRECSLRELAEEELANIPEDEFLYMDSCRNKISDKDNEKLIELLGMDIVNYECVGGGRCFSVDTFDNENMVIFDEDLVQEIIKYES